MKIWKRVSAFLCAVLLILNLALYPLRARAMAGALTAVAGVTVLGAYLMASGVYPYISEAGQSLSEWTSDNLQPLIDKYNAYLINIGKSYQIVLNGATPTIKGYMTQGAIVIANDVWGKLREFVQWIQSEFSLADNQTGVELRDLGKYPLVPFFSSAPSASDMKSSGINIGRMHANSSAGLYMGVGYYTAGVNPEPVYLARVNKYPYGTSLIASGIVSLSLSGPFYAYVYDDYYPDMQQYGAAHFQLSDGTRYYSYSNGNYFYGGVDIQLVTFDTLTDFVEAVRGGAEGNNDAVMVDTTTVAPLEALPDGVEWGGLTTTGNPVETVEDGITDRTKPVVRPVDIEIGAGTEIDSETGEITENPVVVTPEDVVPTVAALSPPASFISALETTMTTKFPFCLPFDLFKILKAFYVAPEAPVFSLTFHDPFSNSDFSIRVDLSPWDEVAAVVRNFEAMILLAGFCLNFDKFNVIHLILGGLG